MNVRVERTISQLQSYRLPLAPLTMRNCILLNRFFFSSSSFERVSCVRFCASVTRLQLQRPTREKLSIKSPRTVVTSFANANLWRRGRFFRFRRLMRPAPISLRYALSNLHKKMIMARGVTQNSPRHLANGIA